MGIIPPTRKQHYLGLEVYLRLTQKNKPLLLEVVRARLYASGADLATFFWKLDHQPCFPHEMRCCPLCNAETDDPRFAYLSEGLQ